MAQWVCRYSTSQSESSSQPFFTNALQIYSLVIGCCFEHMGVIQNTIGGTLLDSSSPKNQAISKATRPYINGEDFGDPRYQKPGDHWGSEVDQQRPLSLRLCLRSGDFFFKWIVPWDSSPSKPAFGTIYIMFTSSRYFMQLQVLYGCFRK